MCHLGNPLCEDMSDNDHRCPRRRGYYGCSASMSDEARLQSVMRALAIADAQGHDSLTLQRHDVRVLCEALRIASAADGKAILYGVSKRNPRFTNPATPHVTTIKRGADLCTTCGGVLTASNRAIHGPGQCWPTEVPAA